jgi:CubicO group peptidase (beta-lactamase class C family)
MLMKRRWLFSGALWLVAPLSLGAEWPAGIVDPEQAIRDPQYSDPVFWWRYTSRPKNVYEPEPYFYWPAAVIEGRPTPFVPQAPQGRESVPREALSRAAAWAEKHNSYALIVVHAGVLQLERYWGRGHPDELTNGRALTRSVPHMLLGFAVADGALSLDDPIGRFITEWGDDPRGRITVRQLAQNVSGLEIAPQLPVTQVAGNKDLCLAYCGDVVRAALKYEQAIAPGTRFEFAQENFQLLGIIIERATGVPLQTLMSERLWKKIGARDAAFQLDRPGGVARIMCCMRATPRDWARLGLLLLNEGRWGKQQVLPAGWVDRMASPSARNPHYGLGLWLGSPYVAHRPYFEGQAGVVPQSRPFLAPDVRMMEGGGFRVIYVVPSRKLVILRLGEHDDDWDHAYLVNTIIEGLGAPSRSRRVRSGSRDDR